MKTMKLTEGKITKNLILLALPIMGTSFLQMAYNLTDMFWIGRVGAKAVAAVGTAGFYTWLAMAFVRMAQIGAEVGVAQAIGKDNVQGAKRYARSAMQVNLLNGVLFGLALFVFRKPLIAFFNIDDAGVVSDAITYLSIIALGIPFYFANPVLSGIFNGAGNSRTPFLINTTGLVMNIVLDPLLIFGLGPIPAMGVAGAALATIIAQMTVTVIFMVVRRRQESPVFSFSMFRKPHMESMRFVIKTGFPVGVQSGAFTVFAMFIARIIAAWGPVPIAVQKVGSQIEAISWMTASGFSTALSAFTGQNFGAGKWERIKKGYISAMGIMTVIGIFATSLLIFGAKPLMALFIPEPEAIAVGTIYLQILGLSQLFMCWEISTAGAFNGLGKTVPPSVISILFTGLRVPFAILLSQASLLGLEGVWWSISMSSVFKGVLLVGWFVILLVTKKYIPEGERLSA